MGKKRKDAKAQRRKEENPKAKGIRGREGIRR
jgi:hypothetical protein